MNTGAQKDFASAKQLRKEATGVKNAAARQDLLDAADRLELRGAKKARKIGRKRRKSAQRGR